MKLIANIIVRARFLLLLATVAMAIVCLFWMSSVNVNEDMTEYLPKNSDMREGLDIMESEFRETVQPEGFKLMFENLTDEEKTALAARLLTYEGVASVDHDPASEDYNSGEYSLFVINTSLLDTDKANELLGDMVEDLEEDYTVYYYYVNAEETVLDVLLPLALGIFMLLLLILCKSYIEVFLLLASIGLSIIINMGTNVFLPSVSDMTLSIAAILQLALSIDYSIILFHRYEQEKNRSADVNKKTAMINAVKHAFSSIFSSAFTTVVGLLALLLMSFTIGRDIGLVLAKGILSSLVCVFTVMPTLVLWCDGLLLSTDKEYLRRKRQLLKGGK